MHPECLPGEGRKALNGLKQVVHGHGFVLAGGTALALRLGHRLSEDLDFFTTNKFSTDRLFREIKNLRLSPAVLQEEQGTLDMVANGVKLSFLHYPYPFAEKQSVLSGVPIAGVVDIAAMKVIAISQRGAKKDFCDLYFVLRDIPFAKIATNMVARFSAERINPIHIGKSLVFFNDAEADPEPRYRGKGPQWEAVKRFFFDNVKQMVLDLELAREKRA